MNQTNKTQNIEAILKSDTFCVYPWIEQVVQANGNFSFCCVGKNGGYLKKSSVTSTGSQNFSAGADQISSAWNSEHLKEIRKDMVNGIKRPECATCFFQESISKVSYRQMHNQEWLQSDYKEISSRVQDSLKSDFHVSKPPLYLDLRLGNICNLKCRSCNPVNSNQILREHEDMKKNNSEYNQFQAEHDIHAYSHTGNEWVQSEFFWDEIDQTIPFLKKIYLTGGEPTLIEKNFKFMQKCVESGYAKNIFLMFNTNGTNLPERFLNYLEHFKFVLVNVSIDAVGPANEYIREGSHWPTIVNNLEKLLQAKGNIQIGITPVIQVYNALSLIDLLKFIEDTCLRYNKKINTDFLYATSPSYLNIQILPKLLKLEMQERMLQFKEQSVFYKSEKYLQNSIDSYLNLLDKFLETSSEKDLNIFKTYTQFLDQKRNKNFETVLPELSKFLSPDHLKAEQMNVFQ